MGSESSISLVALRSFKKSRPCVPSKFSPYKNRNARPFHILRLLAILYHFSAFAGLSPPSNAFISHSAHLYQYQKKNINLS